MSEEVTAAIEYLKQRGCVVGQAFMPVSEGRMHIWIDDIACSYEHILTLAALERHKEAARAIDSPALTELAIACRRIAESGAVDEKVVSATNALGHQWKVLVQGATPPPSSLEEMRSINSQAQALAGRMVDFLKTQLPLLSI
jgi:hypothetical protein